MLAPTFRPSANELSARGAAKELGISRFKVATLICRGVINARSVGRTYVIDRAELTRVLREHPELMGQA